MQYYIIVVFVILVLTALSSLRKRANANYALYFSVFLLFLFSAFRIGFTPDYYDYEIDFDNHESVGENVRHDNETLYLLLVKFLSYRWALILQAFFICLCFCISLKYYVPQRYRVFSIIVFFFCTSFYLMNLSGYRSSFITISLFLASLIKIKFKKGWLIGLVLMIASSLLHQSGWVLIPLLFIPSKPFSTTTYKLLLILSLVIIFISLFYANLLNSLVNNSVQYFEDYDYYMRAEISNTRALGYFTIFRLLMLSFLFFYSFNFCKKKLPSDESIFVKLTALFFLINLLPGIGLISRFYSYFAFTSIAGFGIMVKHEVNSQHKVLFISAFILFSIWSFYLLTKTTYFNLTYIFYDSILFGFF